MSSSQQQRSCCGILSPGLEVIKLEYILRLKIKCNDWLLADTCPQAANHCVYFELENELKFYNLEARAVFPIRILTLPSTHSEYYRDVFNLKEPPDDSQQGIS